MQNVLDFYQPVYTFQNFVAGVRNQDLVRLLQLPTLPPLILWWGKTGCSHLLHALATHLQKTSTKSEGVKKVLWLQQDGYQPGAIHLIDDLDLCDQSLYRSLFYVLQNIDKDNSHLVLTSHVPPAQLRLSADVQTRICAGLIFQLQDLSDEEMISALKIHAEERALTLEDNVIRYAINYIGRDFSLLLHLLTELDRFSLSYHRPITVPLLREYILSQGAIG